MSDTRNPRTLNAHPLNLEVYGAEELPADFVENVRAFGILEPIVIKADGTIISGHRRWRAATAIGLEAVPVRVVAFADTLDERQAILDYNRQREKTFSQRMREGEVWEAIGKARGQKAIELAGERGKEGGRGHKKTPESKCTQGFRAPQTRDHVAAAVGMGSGSTYHRAKTVWEKAKTGDERAQKAVAEIDAGTATVSGALKAIELPHVAKATGENEWYTPPKYIEAALAVMGSIDCDPASSDIANRTVKASTHYTAENNGLDKPWKGNVFINPPYSQPLIQQFADAIVAKVEAGEVKQAVVLVNNATETEWFQSILRKASAVCFVKGRVRFLDPDGKPSGAPLQGQAILYVGGTCQAFADVFSHFGQVLFA